MDLKINGEPRVVPDGLTVATLLVHLQIAPGPVAVEVNTEVVKKADHSARLLAPGDVVEVVSFVGGG